MIWLRTPPYYGWPSGKMSISILKMNRDFHQVGGLLGNIDYYLGEVIQLFYAFLCFVSVLIFGPCHLFER